MGAPGAVILYAIIGLLVYPTSKERDAPRPTWARSVIAAACTLVRAVGALGRPVAG